MLDSRLERNGLQSLKINSLKLIEQIGDIGIEMTTSLILMIMLWTEAGLDYQFDNILKFKFLTRFGISLNFNECVFCHRLVRLLTFLSNMEPASVQSIIMRIRDVVISIPISPYLLNQFQAIDFETLETISLKPGIKQELRQFMDQLYEEYVGIHLKSKKFIDSLADWGQLLKEEKK
ncbi:DNA repair protein RecO [Streptococcus pneumoniae B1598]|nr:DNA repair protein RecO [Streptococcus pneumoniae B1598]